MDERFKKWKYPRIRDGKLTKYNWMVQNKQGLVLGRLSDIGAFTYINAKYGVEIGEEVQIGSHCSIYSISTIDGRTGRVVFGRNARLGSHSVVMPGVSIGENSIVGAFSFVTRDIPDNVIAVGIPAKVVKKIDEK